MSALTEAIHLQVGWCDAMGSPFCAQVLRMVGRSVGAGGVFHVLFAPWTHRSCEEVAGDAAPQTWLRDRLLAVAQAHGAEVRWMGGAKT